VHDQVVAVLLQTAPFAVDVEAVEAEKHRSARVDEVQVGQAHLAADFVELEDVRVVASNHLDTTTVNCLLGSDSLCTCCSCDSLRRPG
jgi:hypothetical protein